MPRDLTAFAEDNRKWRGQRQRVPWQERAEMIEEHFPRVREADWNIILRNDDIFGRLIQDILKVDQIEPGRAGPRPNVNNDRGWQTWREMTGQDYSEQPFAQAFSALARNDSLRAVARKTTICKSKVGRLMNGLTPPTVGDICEIAKAYNKKPAFFAEYRAELIMAAIYARLEDECELTVTIYRKLVKA